MSPSVLTFESIIGNAVNVTRRVVLTMDFFHWMTTANSDSVYGCSVVHKKDTQIAIGESLLSRAASGSGANAWSPHAGTRTQHDVVPEEFQLSHRFLST